ncbi:NADPH-dependent F420 reductase, partial [Mumia zhuanghuii]
MTTIGLIGSGHIGSQLSRVAIAQGYDVVLSNSRGPETLSELVAELGPQARAGTPKEAAEAADLAVVTTPLAAIPTIPVEPLAGKVVIDTNNYYPQRDGQIPELDDESTTVSEVLQRHLPDSKVVKAFNHIAWMHILEDAKPSGTEGRRA